MNSIKQILFLASLALFTFACSNSANKNKAADIDNMTEQIEEAVAGIPAPNSPEMMTLINQAGIGYVFEITNPVENIEKYITTKQKAFNMGVYASDLSYNAAYMKNAESQAYLNNILRLVGDLNIGIDAQKVSGRIEANLNQKDSLPVIVKELLDESQKVLNESSQNDIALYFLTGSWVESAYLTGVIANFSEDKKPLYDIIRRHYDYLSILLTYLEAKKDQPDFNEMFVKLTEAKQLFDELKLNPDDQVKIENLKTKFTDLRNSII